jgi:hypothetical protein
MGYSSASGSFAWAVYNPDRVPYISGNYSQYDLLYWDNPIFTIKTYAPSSYDGTTYNGASGHIVSATPSFNNYKDWDNNVILGGAAASGYTYTCTYSTYNEIYGTHEFIPTTYPNIVIGSVLRGDDTIVYNGQIINVDNTTLNIASGINIYVQWNNYNAWNVVNAQAYNTPITKVS